MANADRCICCGEIVPEGRQICPQCERRCPAVTQQVRRARIRTRQKMTAFQMLSFSFAGAMTKKTHEQK